jgi:hypothetical protein
MPDRWRDYPVPTMRHEARHGDRVVRCFAPRPTSLFAMFAAAVARTPDSEALVCESRRMAYAECDAAAARLAAGLAAQALAATGESRLLFPWRRLERIKMKAFLTAVLTSVAMSCALAGGPPDPDTVLFGPENRVTPEQANAERPGTAEFLEFRRARAEHAEIYRLNPITLTKPTLTVTLWDGTELTYTGGKATTTADGKYTTWRAESPYPASFTWDSEGKTFIGQMSAKGRLFSVANIAGSGLAVISEGRNDLPLNLEPPPRAPFIPEIPPRPKN